jgi:hypothetical protein
MGNAAGKFLGHALFPEQSHRCAHPSEAKCTIGLAALLKMATDGRQHTCGSLPKRDYRRFPRWPTRADTIGRSVFRRGRHEYEDSLTNAINSGQAWNAST